GARREWDGRPARWRRRSGAARGTARPARSPPAGGARGPRRGRGTVGETTASRKRAKASAPDIPTEPLAGFQHLLARSALLGPPCGPQQEQNSGNEPHNGPEPPQPPDRVVSDSVVSPEWLTRGAAASGSGSMPAAVATRATARSTTATARVACHAVRAAIAVIAMIGTTMLAEYP